MGNIETKTKFSRLNSISSAEDNCSFTLVIYLFLRVITKTTDESQTSTDESQTSHRRVTDKSQTSHRESQTSHRRVTDESQTTTNKSQTTKDKSQTNTVESQTIASNTTTEVYFIICRPSDICFYAI